MMSINFYLCFGLFFTLTVLFGIGCWLIDHDKL